MARAIPAGACGASTSGLVIVCGRGSGARTRSWCWISMVKHRAVELARHGHGTVHKRATGPEREGLGETRALLGKSGAAMTPNV